MKLPRVPHSWSLSPREAIALQKAMARQVSFTPPRAIRRVAGLDAAFTSDKRYCLAAVVVWELASQTVLERHVARRRLVFPYIPGLLSFREVPALLAALRRLSQPPDVLMCDGHGVSHPRRFGLACHLGVVCRLPSIGCAKSRLVGTHPDPEASRGAVAALQDQGERIGAVLRTRTGVKPVYVSVGHRMDLETACQVVLDCAIGYRLPEPTRLADRLVACWKKQSSNVHGAGSAQGSSAVPITVKNV